MNKPCINIPRAILGTLASAVAFTAATAVASLNIEGDSHSHRFANGGKTVISFVENGSFTVTGAGTIELLAVGGGGDRFRRRRERTDAFRPGDPV